MTGLRWRSGPATERKVAGLATPASTRLAYPCPRCGAGPWERCRNLRRTGDRTVYLSKLHPGRGSVQP